MYINNVSWVKCRNFKFACEQFILKISKNCKENFEANNVNIAVIYSNWNYRKCFNLYIGWKIVFIFFILFLCLELCVKRFEMVVKLIRYLVEG